MEKYGGWLAHAANDRVQPIRGRQPTLGANRAGVHTRLEPILDGRASNAKAQTLGWTPRSKKEAVLATAESLRALGLA
ncbi:MAG: hypothetical protein EON54_15695 [Alcaligenaceae bacterium]|nr:MAG: hypothetical protein EON54_15695 [Alcaligenaceae bacterium]